MVKELIAQKARKFALQRATVQSNIIREQEKAERKRAAELAEQEAAAAAAQAEAEAAAKLQEESVEVVGGKSGTVTGRSQPPQAKPAADKSAAALATASKAPAPKEVS